MILGNLFGPGCDHGQIDWLWNFRKARINPFPLEGPSPVIDRKDLHLLPEVVLVVDDIGRMPVMGQGNANDG